MAAETYVAAHVYTARAAKRAFGRIYAAWALSQENQLELTLGHAPVAIRGRRLWVQIDSPENLKIRIRGKLVHVPGLKPAQIVVTATGWHPA